MGLRWENYKNGTGESNQYTLISSNQSVNYSVPSAETSLRV